MARGGGRLLQQAIQQTQLRYDPQVQALQSLLTNRKGDLQGEIQGNNAGAQLLAQAIRDAGPQMTDALDQALSTVKAEQAAVAGMPGAQLSADQTDAFSRRLAEEKANTQKDLAAQLIAASQDAAYSNRQARQSYRSDVGKINQQLTDLASQAGTYQSATLGDLREKQAARNVTKRGQDITAKNSADSLAQSERNSIRSAGIDPDTGKPIKGGRLDPKPKKLPQSTQLSAQDKVSQAVSSLKLLDPDRTDRGETSTLLVSGAKSQQVYDPKTGDKKLTDQGTPVMTPDIPAVGGLLASVAADLYYDGHVSRKNEKLLRANGYDLRQLGWTTTSQWRASGGKKPPVSTGSWGGGFIPGLGG